LPLQRPAPIPPPNTGWEMLATLFCHWSNPLHYYHWQSGINQPAHLSATENRWSDKE
jgi:hypothetical protein